MTKQPQKQIEDSDTEIIFVKSYEAKLTPSRQVAYFAITSEGKEIPMPDCYSDMYDNDHLAITKATRKFPSLYDEAPEEHYIPLYTGGVTHGA